MTDKILEVQGERKYYNGFVAGEIIQIDSVEQLIKASRETNIIEIHFEPATYDKTWLLEKLNEKFPGIEIDLMKKEKEKK